MNSLPEFIGRKYDVDELRQHHDFISKEWSRGTDVLPSEIEKTEQEVETIAVANTIIRVWLQRLDIPYEDIEPSRIHILPTESFHSQIPDADTMGEYHSKTDSILIRKESAMTVEKLLALIVHESLHRAHTHKYFAFEHGEQGPVRSGYGLRTLWKSEPQKMIGFNEIVLVYTSFQILNEASAFIEERLGVPKSEWIRGDLYPYMRHATLLESICASIAESHDHSALTEAYTKIIKGQFSKTMLPLKDIERAFGPGSLKVLSLLMSRKDEMGKHLDMLITKYFSEARDKERAELGKNILTIAENSSALESKI